MLDCRVGAAEGANSPCRPTRRPRFLPTLLFILCPGLFAGAHAAPAADAPVVRVAGSAWVSDAPTALADAMDWFNPSPVAADAPRVEVIHVDSGSTAMAHLLRGEVEFALTATTPLALALMGGGDAPLPADDGLLVLASVALSSRTHYVLADRARGIHGPADLAGRRVGVMPFTSAHFGWFRFAQRHGLEQHDLVTVVYDRVGTLADALLAGCIDAAVLWDPWGIAPRLALGDRAAVYSMRRLYTVNWMLVTRRSVLREYPGVAERLLAGYQRAQSALEHDPGTHLRWHAKAIGRDAGELLPLAEGIIWRLTLDWSVLTNMAAQFEWLREQPELDGAEVPPPYSYLFGRPLGAVAPAGILLPPYLLCDDPEGGCPR